MKKLVENLKKKAKGIKENIPALFLAIRKKETPWPAKVTAILAVGYALSPIDLVPDFIPVLGYLDDIIILPVLIALTIKLIPADIMMQCRSEAKDLWGNGKPKKWYYGLPVILIWLLILYLIAKAIL